MTVLTTGVSQYATGLQGLSLYHCLLNLSLLTKDADLTNVESKPSTGLYSASNRAGSDNTNHINYSNF